MELAVISDLHLGRGDAADRFAHDDADFLRYLNDLEAHHERIVLLGDIWETIASPVFGRPHEQLRDCMRAHPRIAERFATDRYVYVYGNHDTVAGKLLGARPEWELRLGGQRILFTHGHEYDWVMRRWPHLERFGVWLGYWMMRWGFEGLFKAAECADKMLRAASSDPGTCPFQRWAVHLAARRSADIIVTGHTHLAARAEHGDHLFLNSGHCTGRNLSFIHMNTRTSRYDLVRSAGQSIFSSTWSASKQMRSRSTSASRYGCT